MGTLGACLELEVMAEFVSGGMKGQESFLITIARA